MAKTSPTMDSIYNINKHLKSRFEIIHNVFKKFDNATLTDAMRILRNVEFVYARPFSQYERFNKISFNQKFAFDFSNGSEKSLVVKTGRYGEIIVPVRWFDMQVSELSSTMRDYYWKNRIHPKDLILRSLWEEQGRQSKIVEEQKDSYSKYKEALEKKIELEKKIDELTLVRIAEKREVRDMLEKKKSLKKNQKNS